ncbi:hypothetical protein [Shewanella baltica]|uniref:Putative regulator for prophage CP-933T n=1 Tax=Shewanella baltica (strain OS155 / ATCC BAA-1091) TaxID=325240 RepID=A3D225_SHEB5|nr:hypothetical protein [Shewanella baltica]ABN60788.1 putative regulator for prophage CP-933T [Shewanella baltica OS155]AEH13134.1 putative regulator for prophage CP-933T [Shewanella baltica OS117]
MNQIALQIATPYVTFEQYATLSGIPFNTVREMAKTGRLPLRPKDRPKEKPLINMLALTREAMEQKY